MRTTTAIPGPPVGDPVAWAANNRKILQSDLDAKGLIYLPGIGTKRILEDPMELSNAQTSSQYIIDRPLFIDQNDTGIKGDGDSEIYNRNGGGVLVLGLRRKPISSDHYPINGGFRTCADSRIAFQSSPWSKLSPQMTISCSVTANAGWSSDITLLFGQMYNGLPGPYYCAVGAGVKLAFTFRTADQPPGKFHTAKAPMSGTSLIFQLAIDLTAGTISYNGQPMACDPPLLPNSAWATLDQQLFQIGTVGDGLMSPAPYDLTFQQLDIGPTGQSPWVKLVGPFNDTPPQPPYVHAYGSDGHTFGFFQGNITNGDTIGGNRAEDLKLTNATKYGQGVGIGLAYDCSVTGCHISGGGQNIGSVNAGASYLVRLRDCILDGATDCNLYFSNATISALGLSLKYFGNSAAVLKGSNGLFTDCITTDSPTCKYVFKMLDNRGNGGIYAFRGGFSNFEGPDKPGISPLAYWYVERHINTPFTSLTVEDFAIGRLGGPAHVMLVDAPTGPPWDPITGKWPATAVIQKGLKVQQSAWSVIQ